MSPPPELDRWRSRARAAHLAARDGVAVAARRGGRAEPWETSRMGACASAVAVVDDDGDAFYDARMDAFAIEWSTVSADELTRVRASWYALDAQVVREVDVCDDADRLARVGEVEMALWMAARGRGALELEASSTTTTERRDLFDRAMAFERDEIDGVDGWTRVDRGRGRTALAAETMTRQGVGSASMAALASSSSAGQTSEETDDASARALASLRHAPSFDEDPDVDERLVVHYGRHKGGMVHSFKLSATFDAPPLRLIAVAREWDLITQWNVFALDSTIMLVRGLTNLVTYTALWLPWPLSCRDTALVVNAVFVGQPPPAAVVNARVDPKTCAAFTSRVSQSSAIVLARAVDPDDDIGIGYPKNAAKRKRVRVVGNSGARIRALPPEPGSARLRTRGDMVLHVDAQMPFVPSSLIKFILKTMAPWVHRMIDSMLKSSKYFEAPDSMFQPRVDANPELYDVVRARFAHEGDVE